MKEKIIYSFALAEEVVWRCRRTISEMTGKFRETIAKTVKIRYS
ncbi:MAG: hypothetical protein ACLUOI_12310 [Eisenbergiella sp.]